MPLLKKADIEASLQEEQQMIQAGKLKEDNPLDLSEHFWNLCEACRRGDLKGCQEMITKGANINARDLFDYTPLILASLCGHFEVVQLLLEAGALCERDTFQGERCLYNALNDRIRNLLLSYDYSKLTDPLQPFAAHIASLLTLEHPQTSDILVASAEESFRLHKFVLSARSPYFCKKLAAAPETTSWRLATTIPPQAFDIAIRYLYFGEIPSDVGGGLATGFTEDGILEGIDKITKQLEIRNLWDGIVESGDRRLARQRRTDEVEKGRTQLEGWFRDNVLRHKLTVEKSIAKEVKWDRQNGIFADVLLQADTNEEVVEEDGLSKQHALVNDNLMTPTGRIPVGPLGHVSRSPSRHRKSRRSTLFPAHRAMLIRSEFFSTMFSSGFREAQNTEYLQVIPIDCSPEVLEIILIFLYTEKTDFGLRHAIDVLFAAEMLLMDKLKMKAAIVISTLGSASISQIPARLDPVEPQEPVAEQDELDIYDAIRAGWLTRMARLEEFGARYMAYRLEAYIDEPEFEDLIRESASRIRNRHETDTIELLDDIRHYLSERFRLRFEDANIDEMENEVREAEAGAKEACSVQDLPRAEAFDLQPASTASEVAAVSLDAFVSDKTQLSHGTIRTLDGELAGDEMEQDAINYQILLGKIDQLLERLRLDA